MATRKMPRAAGWHWDAREAFIHPENGRPSCRWCRGLVQPPKRAWCGDPLCLWEWQRRTSWSLTRQAILERDKGVCALCGLDCERVIAEFREALRRLVGEHQAYADWHGLSCVRTELIGRKTITRVWKARPFPTDLVERFATAYRQPVKAFRPNRTLWDVDHIVPIVEGGDWFSLSNLRTLCAACHRRVTNELNARRRTHRTIAGRKARPRPKRVAG